jgi:hypothetical protein
LVEVVTSESFENRDDQSCRVEAVTKTHISGTSIVSPDRLPERYDKQDSSKKMVLQAENVDIGKKEKELVNTASVRSDISV